MDLPDIVDVVAERPEKFIVFCDDLSFDEGEPGYKALKSILDGSIAAATPNVLIYATSNRRHLLPEYMKDNLSYTHTEDGEVHPGEVIEEKISLSERFGLWVSFYPFSQDEYLAIVGAVAVVVRRERAGDRGGAARGAGLGAGARLAQRPRGLPVRARLRRAAPGMTRAARSPHGDRPREGGPTARRSRWPWAS